MKLKLELFFHFLKYENFKKGIRRTIRSAWKDALWAYNFHHSKKEKPSFESEHEIYND